MGDERIYSREVDEDAPVKPTEEIVRRPPPPLTEDEKKRALIQKNLVHNLAPEFLDVIREAIKLNLISGWRDVTVTPVNPDDDPYQANS